LFCGGAHFTATVTHALRNVSPSLRLSEVAWFASPARRIARNNHSPLRSPVNTRPVRFAPCAPGAKPSTTMRARSSPKPEIGLPQYSSFRYAARFSTATARHHLTNRGHCWHWVTSAVICCNSVSDRRATAPHDSLSYPLWHAHRATNRHW